MSYEIGQKVVFVHYVQQDNILNILDIAPWDDCFKQFHAEVMTCVEKHPMVLENQELGDIVDGCIFKDKAGRNWGLQFPRPQMGWDHTVHCIQDPLVLADGTRVCSMTDATHLLDEYRKEYKTCMFNAERKDVVRALLVRGFYDEVIRRLATEYNIRIKRASEHSHQVETTL